jgi:hypothetical protein
LMLVADTAPESAEVPAQCGWIRVLEAQINRTERHSAGAPTTSRPTIVVTTDGAGVVSHVGSRLLAGMADRSGLTESFSDALAGPRERRSGHDPRPRWYPFRSLG